MARERNSGTTMSSTKYRYFILRLRLQIAHNGFRMRSAPTQDERR